METITQPSIFLQSVNKVDQQSYNNSEQACSINIIISCFNNWNSRCDFIDDEQQQQLHRC